jgi:hypothetical protein
MASTYSTLKIELIGTGEQAGTWGTTTNNNLGSPSSGSRGLEQAIVGMATLVTGDFTSNSYTLPYTNSNDAQDFRALVLNITATLSAAGEVIVPAIEKPYIVMNNSVGGYAVTVKVSGQTGISVPNGAKILLYNNGTDVGTAVTHLTSLTLASALPVASGGTGTTTSTGSGSVVLATSPTLVTPALGTPTSGTLSSCTVDGTDAVGFRNAPVNSQSTAYTLVLADSGKTILHPITDNNARTFTIPANGSVAYAVGTVVTFVNLINTVTIAINTDTMYLAGTGATGSRTLAAYGVATAVKVTSTAWIISGNGLT